ncbi:hypothetical protein BH10ACI1_BH10ACI1_13190 [soil metagenome]
MTKDKKDEIKPLDMTTDEAMNFLFPKQVVDELKQVANKSQKNGKLNKENDLDCNGDSSYIQNSR